MRTQAGWRIYDVQSANGGSLRETVMNARNKRERGWRHTGPPSPTEA
jgi:hypothetical protein